METSISQEAALKIRAQRAVDRIPAKSPLAVGAFYLKMAVHLKKWAELEEGLQMAEPMLRILYSDPDDILADVEKIRGRCRDGAGRIKPLWRSVEHTFGIYQDRLGQGLNRYADYEEIRGMRRQIKGVKQQAGWQ